MVYKKSILVIVRCLLGMTILWVCSYYPYNIKAMNINTTMKDCVYLKNEKVYWVRDVFKGLEGSSSSDDLDHLSYRIIWHNNIIKEGKISEGRSWSLYDLPLMLGINRIEIKGVDGKGNTLTQTLDVLNTCCENMKGAKLDTKDRDKDGLCSYEEKNLGTSDTVADTDGDGVSDYDEVYRLLTNPLQQDSDGNGIKDGEEDFDGDTLNNMLEIELKSNPYNIDTDFDGLEDFTEYLYQTHMTSYDTDGDLVSDSIELSFGLNPHKKDSNADGIEDGETWINTTKSIYSNEAVELSFYGKIQARNLDAFHIMKEAQESYDWVQNIPGYLGPLVSIIGGNGIKEGELRLQVKSEVYGEAQSPMLYTYDEAQMVLKPISSWQPMDSGRKWAGAFEKGKKYLLLNQRVYEAMQETVTQQTIEAIHILGIDTDSDGIVDVIENGRLLPSGEYIQTNPYLADSDKDGIDDQVEIQNATNPLKKDTDGDGIVDSEDINPYKWDVRDRDLAMFAQLAYTEHSVEELRGTTVDEEYFLNLASIEEIKRWEKIHTFTRGQDYPQLRESFAANVYRLEDQIVVAYRGTDGMQDWLENFFIYPLPFISHPQAQDAEAVLSKVIRDYPECHIYVTGHSLGGYLGLYATGAQQGFKKAAQIKTCANFNGLGIDTTAPYRIKRGLKKLQNEEITHSHKIYFDVVSGIGKHYAYMLKDRLAKEVRKKYNGSPKVKWRFLQERHDMANFYSSLPR